MPCIVCHSQIHLFTLLLYFFSVGLDGFNLTSRFVTEQSVLFIIALHHVRLAVVWQEAVVLGAECPLDEALHTRIDPPPVASSGYVGLSLPDYFVMLRFTLIFGYHFVLRCPPVACRPQHLLLCSVG